MSNELLINMSCHCGALKLEINGAIPAAVTSCNCSICRRSGALVAYYNPKNVRILAEAGATDEYSWGDKSIAFVRCSTCGCFSHWRSLDPNMTDRMGVNVRLFTNVDFTKIKVRRFDGADTWKYLDD